MRHRSQLRRDLFFFCVDCQRVTVLTIRDDGFIQAKIFLKERNTHAVEGGYMQGKVGNASVRGRRNAYRPDIDGLRALAVVPVILFHANVRGFTGGFVGVDVFFVISGFLITRLICDEIVERRFSYVAFWERRARRLLPAMFGVIAATSVVAFALLLPTELENYGRSVVSVVLFSSNFYFWIKTGYFDPAAQTFPLEHTWSLAVEEQFYLLFPAVLMATARWKRASPLATVSAIGLISFAISVVWVQTNESGAYYLLPSRAWELMLGAALALVPAVDRELPRTVVDGALLVGIALILIPVHVYDVNTPFPGLAALVPCAGTAIVIWFGAMRSRVARLLDNRFAVGVGRLSYSLYLWHWPIIVFAAMVAGRPPWEMPATYTGLILLTTFVCAVATFVVVENPIRRRKALRMRRPLFITVGASAGLLATLGWATVAADGFQSRIPEPALRIAKAVRDRPPEWKSCNKELPQTANVEDLCRLGPNDQSPRFVLWGDSHALVLFPAADVAAKATNTTGILAALRGCPPIADVVVDSRWADDIDCATFNRRVLDALDSQQFDAVLLAAHWSMYQTPGALRSTNDVAERHPAMTEALRHTIERLESAGLDVFVVDEVPFPTRYEPAQFARSLWWGRNKNWPGVSVAEYRKRLRTLAPAIGQRSVKRISLKPYLCPDGSYCPAIMDGYSNYSDESHLSRHGSARVAPAFAIALNQIPAPTHTPSG
jgi:peptidoglycan/LPS O-acetylase OafA/YrhL